MRAVRSVSFIAVVGLLPACATQGVLFDGHAEPRIARPAELGEVETLPAGYDRIGRLRASCTLVEGAHPGDGAKLVDVDCTESRLMAALRERAAEVGAELLVDRRCRSRIASQSDTSSELDISCDADVARPSGDSMARRPLVSGVMADDAAPRAQEAWAIRVHFAAAQGVPQRPPRRADMVREVPYMPGANLRLGDIVTRCREGCTKDGARLGLMAAAGRFGAFDVVDLSCVAKGKGYQCSGVATAPEVNPELDPRAR